MKYLLQYRLYVSLTSRFITFKFIDSLYLTFTEDVLDS